MEVIGYRAEHYPALTKLWDAHDWKRPPEDSLPSGFVAISKGQVIGAAFFYATGSSMAFLEWVITDPSISPIRRGRAVFLLVEACKNFLKKFGVKFIYTFTANERLLQWYRRVGFKDMEKNVTTMALSLDGSEAEFLR